MTFDEARRCFTVTEIPPGTDTSGMGKIDDPVKVVDLPTELRTLSEGMNAADETVERELFAAFPELSYDWFAEKMKTDPPKSMEELLDLEIGSALHEAVVNAFWKRLYEHRRVVENPSATVGGGELCLWVEAARKTVADRIGGQLKVVTG